MNIRRIIFQYAPVTCIVIASCIAPYTFPPGKIEESIVVQGMITSQPGPYEVDVLRTFSLNEIMLAPRVLSHATVRIEDDQGNSEQLVEMTTGHFFTSTIHGIVGRTYTLTVTTQEGNVYQSTPEKLLPVGEFTLRHQFIQVEDSMANLQTTSANGFRIFIDSEVLPEQEGRVWWRTTGTYHVFTVPSQRTKSGGDRPSPDGSPPPLLPDPPECAGTDFTGPPHPCKCCDCWVTDYFHRITVSDERFVANNQTNNLEMAFVEANRRTMYDKYYLEIQQLSVSQPVYDFWKRVSLQQTNSSSLFQTPYPPTGGNLAALTPGSLPILGYFAASSMVTHSIFLSRADVPYHIIDIDEIDDSCLIAYKNSTNKKPVFW